MIIGWKYRLNFADIWKEYKEGKLSVKELGKKVAQRIEMSRLYKKFKEEYYDLEEIVVDFKYLEENIEEFDDVLARLYDWADGIRCWIKTAY